MLADAGTPFASEWLSLFLRVSLGAIFLMAALSKLPDGFGFTENVRKFQILPEPVAKVYGISVPWLELLGAFLLFTGYYIWLAAGLVIVLVLGFMLAISVAISRGLDLNCQCFGLLYRERVGLSTLARDAVLLVSAVVVLLFDDGRFSLLASVSNLPNTPDLVAFVLALSSFSTSCFLGLLSFRRSRHISRYKSSGLRSSHTVVGPPGALIPPSGV
jgi:uncharacterized membrane protein YphA (DoxX/SURF4 family)